MEDGMREEYLELLKRALTGQLINEEEHWHDFSSTGSGVKSSVLKGVQSILRLMRMKLVVMDTEDIRMQGRTWPRLATTMIGMDRLNNFQACIKTVIDERIAGDIIETGVWRGGASILARACVKAYGDSDRSVWVADSFEGLPKPDSDQYPVDSGDQLWRYSELAVSMEDVKSAFRRYGLLDEKVQFVKGWFKDTLHEIPARKFAVIRLDGDLYESTMDSLKALYNRLSPGGFAIIDDYDLDTCRRAVDDFRSENGIHDSLQVIDWTGRFWRKSG